MILLLQRRARAAEALGGRDFIPARLRVLGASALNVFIFFPWGGSGIIEKLRFPFLHFRVQVGIEALDAIGAYRMAEVKIAVAA